MKRQPESPIATPLDDQQANRTALLNLIATHSFKLGEFTLASGQKSDYYIDCRITTLHAEGGRLAGLVLLDLIRQYASEAEAVGGLTMGADPLVTASSTASAWALAEYTEIAALFPEDAREDPSDPDALGLPPTLLHGFLVRKSEKTHGTGRLVEGFLKPGAEVVIVDDVCTTGGSTIQAIEATRSAGMKVVAVLCLWTGSRGGGCRSSGRWRRCHRTIWMERFRLFRSLPRLMCGRRIWRCSGEGVRTGGSRKLAEI